MSAPQSFVHHVVQEAYRVVEETVRAGQASAREVAGGAAAPWAEGWNPWRSPAGTPFPGPPFWMQLYAQWLQMFWNGPGMGFAPQGNGQPPPWAAAWNPWPSPGSAAADPWPGAADWGAAPSATSGPAAGFQPQHRPGYGAPATAGVASHRSTSSADAGPVIIERPKRVDDRRVTGFVVEGGRRRRVTLVYDD